MEGSQAPENITLRYSIFLATPIPSSTKNSVLVTAIKNEGYHNETQNQRDEILVEIFDYKPCEYSDPKALLAPEESDESGDDDESDADDVDAMHDENISVTVPTSNQLYMKARMLLGGPGCPEKTTYLKRLTAIDDHPLSPQFSKRVHRKAGLIYPIVALPPGVGVWAPSTGKNLRDACRKCPLKAANLMKTEHPIATRDWAETEMSAFMARIEVKIKPFPGMARGYTKHRGSLDAGLAVVV